MEVREKEKEKSHQEEYREKGREKGRETGTRREKCVGKEECDKKERGWRKEAFS